MERISLKVTLAVLLALAVVGCSKEHKAPTRSNPLDPEGGGVEAPPVPKVSSVVVGDRVVIIEWAVSDKAMVSGYRVYRKDSTEVEYTFLDSTKFTSYTDVDVMNGNEYFYSVSALNLAGLEGRRSSPVKATPRISSVNVNGGAPYTNQRQVVLSFASGIDPSGRFGWVWAKVGEDSTLGDAGWEAFTLTRNWLLSPGDGLKRVYAKFKDRTGVESVVVSDKITLDTTAEIYSF